MAKVPVIEQRSVQEAPLPSVRSNQPTPNVGAGLASKQVQGAFQNLGGTIVDIATKAKRRADEVSVLEADTKLSAWVTDRLYNNKTGALLQQGKNALGLPESVKEEYNKFADDLYSGLGSQTQQEAFNRVSATRGDSLNQKIQGHVSKELVALEDQTVKAGILTYKNNAAVAASDNDFVAVKQNLMLMKNVMRDYAEGRGWADEALQATLLQDSSDTHLAVISTLLNPQNPKYMTAKSYLSANKSTMTAEDFLKASGLVDEGVSLAEAQVAADEIMDKKMSFGDAMKYIQGKFEGKKEELVKKITTGRFSDIETQKKLNAEDRHLDIVNKIEEFKSGKLVDPATGRPFPPGTDPRLFLGIDQWNQEKLTARNAYTKMINGVETTDTRKRLDFYDLPKDFVAEMGKREFETKWWAFFDNSDKKEARKYWMDLREGTNKHYEGIQTTKAIGESLLRSKDIKWGKGDSKEIEEGNILHYQFMREFEKRIFIAVDSNNGKPLNPEQKHTIANKLMEDVVLDKGSYLNQLFSGKTAVGAAGAGALGGLKYGYPGAFIGGVIGGIGGSIFNDSNATTKRRFEFTIEDVPPETRDGIAEALKNVGKTVSEKNIIDVYFETLKSMEINDKN